MAGAQVLDQMTGVQVVSDQVAGAQVGLQDQVAGVQVGRPSGESKAGTQEADHC